MATQERSPVNIAIKFAKKYYLLQGVETASSLLVFYQEDSTVTRGNEVPGVGAGVARGLDKIKTAVTDPTYLTRDLISIRTIDAQFVADSADISILVVGELVSLDGLHRTFVQSFLLAVSPGSDDNRHYYVKNDIFRYLSSSLPEVLPQAKAERVQEPTPAAVPAPAESAKSEVVETIASPAKQETAPVAREQPAQETTREQPQEERRRPQQQRGGQQRNQRQQAEKKEEPKPAAPVSWAARVAAQSPAKSGDAAPKEAAAPVKQARPPQGLPPKSQPTTNGHAAKVGVPNSPVTTSSLHLGNLPYNLSDDQVKAALVAPAPEGYGWEGVEKVQTIKGHGFVDFKSVEHAQVAYAVATAPERTPLQLGGRDLRVEPKTGVSGGSRSGRGGAARRRDANGEGNRRSGAQ